MSTRGDMLRLARQRLGIRQGKAAEAVGVTQPVLSRVENGLSEPDQTFLDNAARAYDVPQSFFDVKQSVYGPPVSVHPMLRSKANLSGLELEMITAELNIRIFHLSKFMDAVDFSPSLTIPTLDIETYNNPAEIAGVLRAHWQIPSGPIKNLTALAEQAGIIVAFSDFGGASVSGVTFRIPGKAPLILLNKSHPADRTRFTLAHELGHVVMHSFPNHDMEKQADAFAAAFLMPEYDIREAFRGRRVGLHLLATLKPEWKVAMQALLYRANTLKIIDYNQNRYLWQTIAKNGWRKREPAETEFAHEETTVLPAIIKAQFSELGYTLGELAKVSHMNETEFVKYYGDFDTPKPGRPRLRIVT
ncbi:MAG: DNA-binding protein [Robiginitomaculum sp.]|nr:MAG: DNA-binding protein [Robiginitomaculum sp.]